MKKIKTVLISGIILLSAGFLNLPASAGGLGLYSKKTSNTEEQTDTNTNTGVYNRQLRSDTDGNLDGDPNNGGTGLGTKAPLGSGLATLIALAALYGICKYKNGYRNPGKF
jgi:hypothetical protein